MGKLTRLINEYGKTNGCGPFETYRVEPTSDYYYTSYLVLQWDDNGEGDWKDWHLPIPTLISKEYGFIKWLVENDKIDRRGIDKPIEYIEFYSDYNLDSETHHYSDVDSLIMLLSIQDEPIRFLCEIIK